jgi:hypothetical protein
MHAHEDTETVRISANLHGQRRHPVMETRQPHVLLDRILRRDRLCQPRSVDDFSEVLQMSVVYVATDPPRVPNPANRHP